MNQPVKVLFLSDAEPRQAELVEKFMSIDPDLPLWVVSEFRPPAGRWIPYKVCWTFRQNLARVRAALHGRTIRRAAMIFDPKRPCWRMRWIALLLAAPTLLIYNEHLDHFMLRPRGVPVLVRHLWWRWKDFVYRQIHPGGRLYTWLWRLRHPSSLVRPFSYRAARIAGRAAALARTDVGARRPTLPPIDPVAGIAVVIPSRNGIGLLEKIVPQVLAQAPDELIVVDNGSDDGSAAFLRAHFPTVIVEESPEPLSFARAVNLGIRRARSSHVCLLNNDMSIEPGFLAALAHAFLEVPGLFAATAQIFFPRSVRREETGKAVMPRRRQPTDFPVSCDPPIPGENHSPVLYGSGGCTLYDARKLSALGGFDEVYQPAYVEDLDIGVRAWQRGWGTVFVAPARVLHQHRATTSRYYSSDDLDRVLEINYLRFLARCIGSPGVFKTLWREAVDRLNLLVVAGRHTAMPALQQAAAIAMDRPPRSPDAVLADSEVLALGSGDIAVFPGRARRGNPPVLVASPYLPFPLSHGGAVRIYNLMRRAAADFDQVLVAFTTDLAPPPGELLDIAAEIVLVRMTGSHVRARTPRPDVVEEFDAPAFHAALRQTVRKWRPGVAQLEFTQMAQYAADCAPAKTILVEHDVTLDLYRQLLSSAAPGGLEELETREELRRWESFERAAWTQVDCVVTMSDKDRRSVAGRQVIALPNGVDLDRFRPAQREPEPRRLLFVGSFAHLPNVMAMAFFLDDVWPRLSGLGATLHVIAGSRHRYYLDHYSDRVTINLDQPAIEVEDFVSDPRKAYERAAVVVAPLVASAGTNIKIIEAMAMGRAIVSTPAGINGLDLSPGRDVLVATNGAEMAEAIALLITDPDRRRAIEREARATVERDFGWDAIARRQKQLYRALARP